MDNQQKKILDYITGRINELKEGKRKYVENKSMSYTRRGHEYWNNINILITELENIVECIKLGFTLPEEKITSNGK